MARDGRVKFLIWQFDNFGFLSSFWVVFRLGLCLGYFGDSLWTKREFFLVESNVNFYEFGLEKKVCLGLLWREQKKKVVEDIQTKI